MSEVRYQRWLFEHTHMKVSWIKYSTEQKDEILTYPPPVYSIPSSPYVRFLTKHQSSTSSQSDRPEVSSRSDALERQLQQLFHLHDSGLDQAFIDALPVFMYKEVVGSKEPFDCAVCLCEFTDKDKLRLLPTCSHAFHISCIDTWLLSNSTCPLCRGTLFSPGFSMENPMFDFDDPSDDGCHGNRRYVLSSNQKTIEIEESAVESGVLPVRLGKFRKLKDGSDDAGGETSSSNLDARRCFSMGSYQYVVADTSLEVALNNVRDGSDAKLVKRKERSNSSFPDGDDDGKKICIGTKTDSYSVSKIWLWSKKGQFSGSSDTRMDYPSSLDHELPWMRRTEVI
ncbi:RING-H2 finger protein ATL46 [Heracleum sosnowskyi]|uniref:RING-type E3 ubiquitin transferase n=1 Tax=Heracleum sosnowskyi TaxID=360622 RepID=A0AAD8H4K9_9APIA|nr:RING-H2 finger protein ATL46 [Heracleum sosnowskyi]